MDEELRSGSAAFEVDAVVSDDGKRTGGNRTGARRQLEQGGVEYERATASTRVDNVVETIQQLKSRIHSVTEGSLTQLRETDRLSPDEFRLFIETNVLCEDCSRSRISGSCCVGGVVNAESASRIKITGIGLLFSYGCNRHRFVIQR